MFTQVGSFRQDRGGGGGGLPAFLCEVGGFSPASLRWACSCESLWETTKQACGIVRYWTAPGLPLQGAVEFVSGGCY